MIFTIDQTTYAITGTKGDSGAFIFNFNKNMDGATACFVVKEKITTDDVDAYIEKSYTFPTSAVEPSGNNVFIVSLLPGDTLDIPIVTEQDPPKYDDFVWGLRVYKGTTYAETVIPRTGGTYPKFRMYYNISECQA